VSILSARVEVGGGGGGGGDDVERRRGSLLVSRLQYVLPKGWVDEDNTPWPGFASSAF
jgi:hypothetical protein